LASSGGENKSISPALTDAVEVLLWLGASMLRAGNTAIRTREWMEAMARNMGFDEVSVSLSIDTVGATARRSGERATGIREIGPPGINAQRISELEKLVRTTGPGVSPRDFVIKLAEIDSTPPRYSRAQIATAIGAASSGFAFLNGGAAREMIAAGIGAGIGQWWRSWLSLRQLNQYGIAALAAAAASGVYALTALLAGRIGFEFAHYPAGFVSSVLFLVPGFPLIAGLFDLLHYQTVAAVSRLAYGVMLLLAVTLGLSIVIVIAEVDLLRQPPLEFPYPLTQLLRAIASFVAGAGFAMLFNSSARTIFAVGLLAVGANGLRLMLHDAGMTLASAAFFGSLAVGLVALFADQRFNLPRLAVSVPAIIIMVPGLYAFETIVLFNRGQVFEALQACAACGFIIGALAMGLATARFFSRSR
jgi:uncharacterized membrane protein YjjP (DUF1212 family)